MTQALNSGYVTICSENPNGGNLFIHERDENGKMKKMIDGFGDVKEVAQRYMAEGFDPKKIKINGQLASDVFQLSTKEEEPKRNFFQRIGDKFRNYKKQLSERRITIQVPSFAEQQRQAQMAFDSFNMNNIIQQQLQQ